MSRTLVLYPRPPHIAASHAHEPLAEVKAAKPKPDPSDEPLAEVKAAKPKPDPSDERLFAELRTVGGPSRIETSPEFRKAMKEVLGIGY